MHELAKVTLQNEMDLILAHKRSTKLAELAGLSLSAQTTFATAVSEVSRTIIESEKGGCLILNVDTDGREKYIVASLRNEQFTKEKEYEGLAYAKRLVNKYTISTNGKETSIDLFYFISPSFRIDIHKLDEWRQMFRNEPPISPYEELKRKNEQLLDISGQLQKSEAQYKTLTNSLPMIIFSFDTEGQLLYANEWLTKYTGQSLEDLNKSGWKSVVHTDDYNLFSSVFASSINSNAAPIKIQIRLKNKNDNDYLWHQISLSPFKDNVEESQYWIGFMVDIHMQKVLEETLKDNKELKEIQEQLNKNQHTLEKYIEELNRSNQELQQFAFVASHDLQEPVRKLLFYSDYLVSQYTDTLDQKGVDYLKNLQGASQRMRSLIHDILLFSQINKEHIKYNDIDLNEVVKTALLDFEMVVEEKGAVLNIQSLPVIKGDERMMHQLFENIISNSLKYAQVNIPPVISISCQNKGEFFELSFRDNGIGFDQQYLSQIFSLFQRLHDRKTYEGTGLGLAICRKIVDMHGGRMWAEGKEGEGAVFYVSLPINQSGN